MVTDARRM